MTFTTIRLAALATAIALPALAADAPPASSTPPSASSSSSGGSTTSSSGGSPTSIPEPAAIGLFALGITGAALIRRRQRRKPD